MQFKILLYKQKDFPNINTDQHPPLLSPSPHLKFLILQVFCNPIFPLQIIFVWKGPLPHRYTPVWVTCVRESLGGVTGVGGDPNQVPFVGEFFLRFLEFIIHGFISWAFCLSIFFVILFNLFVYCTSLYVLVILYLIVLVMSTYYIMSNFHEEKTLDKTIWVFWSNPWTFYKLFLWSKVDMPFVIFFVNIWFWNIYYYYYYYYFKFMILSHIF